jgi:tetratricopeptide (TPR) repeat protein
MKVNPLNIVQGKKMSSLLEKAGSAQRLGRWAEAYEAYRSALPRGDRRFGILVQLGHMSKEMGNFQQAETHYAEALQLRPDDWDLHVQFGHLYKRSGDLEKARGWYAKAQRMKPTTEITELLYTIDDASQVEVTSDLRQQTLDQMDSRKFQQALPNALALYEKHGLRDFDVIVGHALRELGRYREASEMYRRYFERCMLSNSKHLNDAFWHLLNILEITEERQEILGIFVRLKRYYLENGKYSDFDGEQAALLRSHIAKLYSVFQA